MAFRIAKELFDIFGSQCHIPLPCIINPLPSIAVPDTLADTLAQPCRDLTIDSHVDRLANQSTAFNIDAILLKQRDVQPVWIQTR
jgi:hypothetical protein